MYKPPTKLEEVQATDIASELKDAADASTLIPTSDSGLGVKTAEVSKIAEVVEVAVKEEAETVTVEKPKKEVAVTSKNAIKGKVFVTRAVAAPATEEEIDINDLTEAELMALPSIVAKPLGMSSSLDIKVKRKEYAYRWINRLSDNGNKYSGALSIGYVNANSEDVEVLNPSILRDGCLIVGDLILMKMPKLEYIGALKANANNAERVSSKKALDAVGMREGANAVSGVKAPKAYEIHKKVSFYTPPSL